MVDSIWWYLTDGKIILLRERNMVKISLKNRSFENDALANSEHNNYIFYQGTLQDTDSGQKCWSKKKKKIQDPEAKKEE